MKNIKTIICSTACAMAIALSMTSCEDFLDVTANDELDMEDAFQTYDELREATAYLYAMPWYDFHVYMHYLGDARGNNLYSSLVSESYSFYTWAAFSATTTSSSMTNSWRSFYNVITNADYIIQDYIPLAEAAGVDEDEIAQCEGEARFMRAVAYWYLSTYWHDVPIIDDPRDYLEDFNMAPNRFEDVVQYAIYDLEYAAEHLPDEDDTGRVTSWSAQGMLSRVYLTAAAFARGEHCSDDMVERYADEGVSSNEGLAELFYSKAKECALDVMENATDYGLMDDYEEIFRVQNNNCKEVLWALQFVPSITTIGLRNDVEFAYDKEITGGHSSGGTYHYASYDMGKLFIEQGGRSRRRGNIFVDLETYDYIGTHTPSGTWTVGYTDGQQDSARSQRTVFNIKKFTVGSYEDTGGVAIQYNTGFRTPMLRMSEVYLNYVEACMGTKDVVATDKDGAVTAFNTVRRRAWAMEIEEDEENADVEDYETQYSDMTSISRNDLLKEYRMELFMEGLWWPILLRRSFYQADWVVGYMNNELIEEDPETDMTCYRWWGYGYESATNKFTSLYSTTASNNLNEIVHEDLADGDYVHSNTAQDNLWAVEYPDNESSLNSLLNSTPVAYDFDN